MFGFFIQDANIKIQNSEERGALGVLVYSDVRDDGGVTVENGFLPYPEGPARQVSMIQRGSVQYVSLYPGDPSTPGFPAYKNSTRVESSWVFEYYAICTTRPNGSNSHKHTFHSQPSIELGEYRISFI